MDKSNLRIALVSLQEDAEKVPPIGLVYLATYLNQRVGLKKENILVLDKNYFNLDKEIDSFRPDIVGISAMTIDYPPAIALASKLKIKNPHQLIILGGVHVSILPESMKDCFDIGVMGEGEETLRELIELYLKKEKFDQKDLVNINGLNYFDKGNIKQTEKRKPLELDSLPLPDFTFIPSEYFKKEEIPGMGIVGTKGILFSSRGCPYRCEFCSTSRFWGKMRLHSPEYTARLAEDLVKKYNVDYISIIDDLFTLSPERVREIKKEFDKRGLLNKIKGIGCMVRANLMSDELCKAMKELKIKIINFGFESGSEKVLKYLKAGSVSVEMNKRAVVLGKKYGLNVYGSLMYGSPSENINDMKQTNEFIDFCIKHKIDNLWSFVTTPFPGTPFWQIALSRGTVSNEMDFSLLDHHISQRPLLLDKEISTEEFRNVFEEGKSKLRKLRTKLIIRFLLKNPLNAPRLVLTHPKYYLSRVVKQLFKQ